MDNSGNIVPNAGLGGTEPQAQPAPTAPAQPTVVSPVQPVVPAEAPVQPMTQMQPGQPAISQPIVSQLNETNTSNNTDNKQRKKLLIIGCSIGGAIILLIAILLIVFLSKGSEKTVICNAQTSIRGIEMDTEARVVVHDGEVTSASSIVNVNLKTLDSNYKPYEQQLSEQLIERFEDKRSMGCEVEQEYVKGDHIKIIMTAKNGTGCITSGSMDAEGISAQKLADKIQAGLERSMGGTCKQE